MSANAYYAPEEDEIIRTYYPTVTHAEIMQMLPSRTSHGIRTRACRLGILNKQREHHKQGYNWVLSGNRQVMSFLREIIPYLVIKKEQAELLADGYLHLPEEERFALFQKIRDLKKTS